MKKYVDFVAMVLNLEHTLVSLGRSDREQEKSIGECIGMLKSLRAHIQAQEKRLALLESCFFLYSLPARTREPSVYHCNEALPNDSAPAKSNR